MQDDPTSAHRRPQPITKISLNIIHSFIKQFAINPNLRIILKDNLTIIIRPIIIIHKTKTSAIIILALIPQFIINELVIDCKIIGE